MNSATVPPEVWAALAEVCGYHDGDPCEHCVGAAQHWAEKGRSWPDLLADIRLYRDDYPAWEAKVRAEGRRG